MYVPASNEVHDPEQLLALIERHPFATLVTPAADGLRVSHVPLVARRGAAGITLVGHVARANDHWRVMGGSASSTAVFHGPHAYVSPTWYDKAPAVPTWNYVVVHVTGPTRVEHDGAVVAKMLDELTERYEIGDGAWRPSSLPEGRRRELTEAIVAFELRADALQGKVKLGQHRSAADRAGVVAHLETGDDSARAIAAMIRATLEEA